MDDLKCDKVLSLNNINDWYINNCLLFYIMASLVYKVNKSLTISFRERNVNFFVVSKTTYSPTILVLLEMMNHNCEFIIYLCLSFIWETVKVHSPLLLRHYISWTGLALIKKRVGLRDIYKWQYFPRTILFPKNLIHKYVRGATWLKIIFLVSVSTCKGVCQGSKSGDDMRSAQGRNWKCRHHIQLFEWSEIGEGGK